MEEQGTPKYTVGFIFSSVNLNHVLLVHKQKPEWQKGRVNGVGGKVESGESPEECISRETKEETCLAIPPKDWVLVGRIVQQAGDVAVFAAEYGGALADAKKGDHEEVEWFPVASLPSTVIDNLKWMVPLAQQALQGAQSFQFTLKYLHK